MQCLLKDLAASALSTRGDDLVPLVVLPMKLAGLFRLTGMALSSADVRIVFMEPAGDEH